jgi:hypothetical protein
VQLFASLCFQVFSEYLSLKCAYENEHHDDVSLLAWRARNLLELSVWSTYCAKSRQNAWRVYEDAGRDVRGIYNAFLTWGAVTGQAKDWMEPITAAKQNLSQRALALDGIESLEGPYKQVRAAAKECDLRDHFSLSYKMLSKFSHPSAMRIVAPPSGPTKAVQRDFFFGWGCLFFLGAFNALEGPVSSVEV